MRGLNALAKEVLRAGINQMKSGVDYLPMQMFPIGSCAEVELVGSDEERGEAVGSQAETSTCLSAPLLIEVGIQSTFSTRFIF